MIRLFGSYTSPFVRHCRIALAQAELPFEFVETDYAQSAVGSPTQRVPYATIDGQTLTDSTSILKFVREAQGHPFLPQLDECELYCLANTLLDTTINLFLLERDGLTVDAAPYLKRQLARIHAILGQLNDQSWQNAYVDDGVLRLCCYLDWVIFRDRLDLSEYPHLLALLEQVNTDPHFAASAPPK
ncbi:glutathione S-transferase family protein [Aliidiomarina indica]|uniref:glutathione S-transferase family protein n=1 Tax=Aliidiomarina indica TaxID=2749147 RepID=UPI001890A021|nr:glutathione S-transferase family protein [Aliidiomarina indica]